MMTRKTYETAARAIRDARPYRPETDPLRDDADTGRDLACNGIAHNLAVMFAADNPRFDRVKFLAATRKDA